MSSASVVLRSGARLPTIGFGTFQARRKECQEAVECALDVGYRHIDTAISYQNEGSIGPVLSHSYRQGKLKRRDLFLTSKVPPVYLHQEDVIPQVNMSLEKLETKYLDMLLIHFPVGNVNRGDGVIVPLNEKGERLGEDIDYIEVWKELETLVKQKKVKSIGLSNFNCEQMDKVIANASVPLSNLQLECHAYLQQDKIRAYAKKNDIVLTGYAPLGAPSKPAPHVPVKDTHLLDDPVVLNIAEKVKCTPGQLLIRFVSQLGVVPLPKSVKPSRILENYEAMSVNIPENEFQELRKINIGQKYFPFLWATEFRDYPHGDF